MSSTLNKKLVMQWLNQEIEAIKAFEKRAKGRSIFCSTMKSRKACLKKMKMKIETGEFDV